MDIFRAFSLNDKEHLINIQGTIEDPLFQGNQIGELLGIKNFHAHINDFTDEHKVLCQIKTNGGIQNVIFLTELGLYKLLGRSRKDIAAKFQNWIVKVIKEIRITGMYRLNEEKEVDKKLLENNQNIINNRTFIKAFHNKNIIYICKFKNIDEKFIIKIGSTQNIKERIYNLNNQFENIEPNILDIIEVNNYRKYEKYLHNHPYIKQFYYEFIKKDGTISNETYLTTEEQCNYIINILNEDKKKFDIDAIELENLRLKIEEKKSENNLIELKINEYKLKQKEIEALRKDTKVVKNNNENAIVINFKNYIQEKLEPLESIKDEDIDDMVEGTTWEDIVDLYDSTELVEEDELEEALSAQSRLKKRQAFMRGKSKRNMARGLKLRRASSPETLKKRAISAARRVVYKRILRGRNKSNLSAAEKSRIEQQVSQMKNMQSAIVTKMMPKIRSIEQARLAHYRGGK